MQQNQKRVRGLHLLLLVLSQVTAFCVFGWLFATPPLTRAQTLPSGWLALPSLRSGVGEPAIVVVDGKIHVIGGIEYFGSSGFHEAFDPVTQRWASLPDLPHQLGNAAAAVMDDRIYVMGGYNVLEGGALAYTHIYETATKKWLTATSMISPASGAGAAVISHEIYVFGGYDNEAESRLVQSYDPVHDRWTLRSPMPVGRSEFGLAVVDGLIYAIGGNIRVFTGTHALSTRTLKPATPRSAVAPLSTAVSVYDPANDSWRAVAPLPAPRVSMAVAVRNEQIYVMGGTDFWVSGTVQSSVYLYEPAVDQWSVLSPMPTPRSGARATALNDAIYVFGGYDQAAVPLPTTEGYGLLINQLYLPLLRR